MTTFNTQVAASLGDSQQHSGANNVGRTYTNSGLVVANDTVLSPGSHGTDDEWSCAARFPAVTIPQGATVNSASFKMTIQSGWDAGALGRVVKYYASAQASDDAPALIVSPGNLTSTTRPRSTATGVWPLNTTTTDVEYSVDITTVIQEIVNRPGWVSGNAIAILIDTHEDCTQGEWQDFWGHDGSAAKAPRLAVDYTTSNPPVGRFITSRGMTQAVVVASFY